ncbi:MAG: hypothetical protein HY901_32855 [Deltaproteobacteria bacterium]|nr:hypothetical protein [Deltaproteobacteria bacterium]
MNPTAQVAVQVLAIVTALASTAVAEEREDLAPSYSRGGFDYFSAVLEPGETRVVSHHCEKQYGKHTEVEELADQGGYRCSVPTASEPRLSTRLNEEIALVEVAEPKRQKVVGALIDKFARLAQCPAGTEAYYDGSMYFCQRTFKAKELCPSGTAKVLDSGSIGCVVSSCPKGHTDLGALSHGKHPGCFQCPKGSYDEKETEAFHGAASGMPADFKEVFCRSKRGGAAPEKKEPAPERKTVPAAEGKAP